MTTDAGNPVSNSDAEPLSTPVAGPLAVTPLYVTAADLLVKWDDPGATWRSVPVPAGATGPAGPAGAAGAFSLIATRTASGSADLQWTGLTGKKWKIIGNLLLPATNSAQLLFQYGTGTGPTWHGTGYYQGGRFDGLTVSASAAFQQSNQNAFKEPIQQTNAQQGASFDLTFETDNATFLMVQGIIKRLPRHRSTHLLYVFRRRCRKFGPAYRAARPRNRGQHNIGRSIALLDLLG
jgi:hypothetical protein